MNARPANGRRRRRNGSGLRRKSVRRRNRGDRGKARIMSARKPNGSAGNGSGLPRRNARKPNMKDTEKKMIFHFKTI